MVDIVCIINGRDISDKIRDNLLNMTIVDNDGIQADTLNMTLSDYIKRPEGEDEIKIWINGSFYGIFIVNETETNHLSLLTVSATSANFHKTLKSKKNMSYVEMSLHDIINSVASEHGLETKIDCPDIVYEVMIKEKESDLHFLKRLAEKYDSLFSIKNNTLIFRKRENDFPIFTININHCHPWSIRHIAKKKYGGCVAKWRDTKENTTLSATAGAGEPLLNISGDYLSEAEGRLVAKGALAKSQRETKEGSFTKAGEYLSAGSKVTITHSKQDDGIYTISTVTTVVDRSRGFAVSVKFKN